MLRKASLICALIELLVAQMTLAQQSTCNLQTTKPEPKVYKYSYENCIMAQFAGYFIDKAYNMYLPIENGRVNLKESSCNYAQTQCQLLIINFSCGNLDLFFAKNSLNQIYIYYISGELDYDGSTLVISNNTPVFNTSLAHYYKCDAEQTLDFGTISLNIKNVAIEAYRNTTGTDFSKIPDECYMDSQALSNLVRIGVGVSLFALVAIVIIGYFVARRRLSGRGAYESV